MLRIWSEMLSETEKQLGVLRPSQPEQMFEPIRGGTRGGQAEFKWSDVAADKDREHYLGHSINAPTGRWQKNKDVHWYGRGKNLSDLEREEEIRKVKEAEAEALAVALGFGPTGANATQPTTGSSAGVSTNGAAASSTQDDAAHEVEKEERRRRRAERKEGKRARKEARKAARDDQDDRTRRRDRSWSPNWRGSGDEGDRRSRSPTRDHEERRNRLRDYDANERERERERHRRLWDTSAARHGARHRDS